MSLPDYNYLLLEQEDSGVTVVTINRASKLNAMNTEMMTELTDCFRKLSELSDVRVVVLTGSAPANNISTTRSLGDSYWGWSSR